MVTLLIALQIWVPVKSEPRPAGRKVIWEFFLSFSLKSPYYPAYHIGPDFSN